MELYKNIKNRRQELNLSQTELANRVGYKDKGSISRIENGSLDLTQSQIIKFANALECTPSYLMGWDGIDRNNLKDKEAIINSLRAIADTLRDSELSPITDNEYEIIKKIRDLDDRGKSNVLRTISEELKYSRMNAYAEGIKSAYKDSNADKK